MLESLILPGISFGLAATALPGPLQAYLISTTLALGWRRGILVIFSPLITDAPIILLVLFILGRSPDALIPFIQLIGGLFLLWLAWGAWKDYRAGSYVDADAEATPVMATDGKRVLLRAVVMNFFSPGPYLFWGTVNGRLLLDGLEQSLLHGLVFLVAFYGTFLGGLALTVFIFARIGQLDARFSRLVLLTTIVLLAIFGLIFIRDGALVLLQ